MLSWIEWLAYLLAICMLAFHFKFAGYEKKGIIIHTIIIAPFLYFSINMLTEVVTADEGQYIFAFVDPQNIKMRGSFAFKVLYEYKFSQLTIGTIFSVIPTYVRERMGEDGCAVLYKILHYFLMLLISLMTARVWRNQIFEEKSKEKLRVSEDALLITLIGMPLACLLLKVCNYDSGSTYLAILGFSLLWGAYKRKSLRQGFWSTMVVALGVLDKWTALPYFCIAVVLFAHLIFETSDDKKYVRGLLGAICVYISSNVLGLITLLCLKITQGGLIAPIGIGNVTFSFTHAARGLLSPDMSIDYTDATAYDNDALRYVFLIIIAIAVCYTVVEFLIRIINDRLVLVINKCCAIFEIAVFAWGGYAAYRIPLKIAEYSPIKQGYYQSLDNFDGWTYHYGAKTAIGHFLYKIGYMFGTIICSYPTLIMICILTVAFIIVLRKREFFTDSFAGLLWSSALLLMLAYAVAGLPSGARYFSFSIYMLALVAIFYGNKIFDFKSPQQRSVITMGMILAVFEMALYLPNFANFSPIWIVHDADHNHSIRKGEWYIGETMLWGEELAIAGNKIQRLTDAESVKLFTNYGGMWLQKKKDKRVEVKSIYTSLSELEFDESTYYVFNKFRLFRDDVPEFIYDLEPVETIEFKGDIGAWIYRGDQLKSYQYYFEEIND